MIHAYQYTGCFRTSLVPPKKGRCRTIPKKKVRSGEAALNQNLLNIPHLIPIHRVASGEHSVQGLGACRVLARRDYTGKSRTTSVIKASCSLSMSCLCAQQCNAYLYTQLPFNVPCFCFSPVVLSLPRSRAFFLKTKDSLTQCTGFGFDNASGMADTKTCLTPIMYTPGNKHGNPKRAL